MSENPEMTDNPNEIRNVSPDDTQAMSKIDEHATEAHDTQTLNPDIVGQDTSLRSPDKTYDDILTHKGATSPDLEDPDIKTIHTLGQISGSISDENLIRSVNQYKGDAKIKRVPPKE